MELKNVIEALLFATPKPLSVKELRSILTQAGELSNAPEVLEMQNVREPEIYDAIEALKKRYEEESHSFQVLQVAEAVQLVSKVGYAPWLRQLLESRPNRLSQPALETLAIIAYRQPITRAEIEAVRGVAVDGVVKSLLERGLIKMVGRSDAPGKPLQYGTTQLFLEHFGINKIEDLPASDELKKQEARKDQEPTATQLEAALTTPDPSLNQTSVAEDPAAASQEDRPAKEGLSPGNPESRINSIQEGTNES